MAQNKSRRLLWAVCLAALAAFAAAMVWLHYQQLCSPGGGSDPYTSDLGMHLAFAQRGMVYSTVSLLIGPAYALAGRIGIAVLLAAFHLAAVAVFAYGLRAANAQPSGNFAVGHGLAARNGQKNVPHRLPEGGTLRMQGRQNVRVFSTEINVQPPDSFGQNGRFFFLIVNAQKRRKIFLCLEPEPCQAGFIACQQNAAER